ncbi:dysbindin-A-like isoform X2 [Haliotis asinina]|uniref:dysbindin-A-like isoform X2 n=1 Tax=Haliotis asinina TaxID=109174 RepID=UPI00353233E5
MTKEVNSFSMLTSLKALTSLDAQPRQDVLRRLRSDGVSLDAGADLLNKYQRTWKELQMYTSRSAKKAEEVDSEISQLYNRWNKQVDFVSQMEEEVAELPDVVTLVQKLTIDLGYIKRDCEVVEGALERLENVVEELEQQKSKKGHLAQLASYKKKKMEEVQKVKVHMAKSHARAMQECDRRRQANLKERQEAFNDAFTEDMDFYKTHGHTEQLKVSDIPMPKVSSLSDITIDDDQMVINSFLASTETTPSKERAAGDLGDDSEGAFFEDDYTADYNVQDDEDLLEDDIEEMSHEPAEREELVESGSVNTDSDDANIPPTEKKEESAVPHIPPTEKVVGEENKEESAVPHIPPTEKVVGEENKEESAVPHIPPAEKSPTEESKEESGAEKSNKQSEPSSNIADHDQSTEDTQAS